MRRVSAIWPRASPGGRRSASARLRMRVRLRPRRGRAGHRGGRFLLRGRRGQRAESASSRAPAACSSATCRPSAAARAASSAATARSMACRARAAVSALCAATLGQLPLGGFRPLQDAVGQVSQTRQAGDQEEKEKEEQAPAAALLPLGFIRGLEVEARHAVSIAGSTGAGQIPGPQPGAGSGMIERFRGGKTGRQHAPRTAARPLRLGDRAAPPPHGRAEAIRSPPSREGVPARIGHYAIARKLGAGRHGRRLRGARRAAGAHGRAEDDVVAGPGRDGAQALLARGPGGGERQPSERLPALRDRRGRRRAVHRHGAAGGRGARRAPAARGR